MLTQSERFRATLLDWYDAHARDLPWRRTRDPYRIWLSEVMLQQTRVAAVIEHYHEFLRRFPTIEKLAAAREASVLAAWSGLGYYRRARMLHAAAKLIARDLEGKFPTTAKELLDLPGIGRYTSAAIASIAFDEPIAVVDGNVERVLLRTSGRSLASRRFQSGNHGAGSDGLHPTRSVVSDVPRHRSMRNPRRKHKDWKNHATEKARDSLRSEPNGSWGKLV